MAFLAPNDPSLVELLFDRGARAVHVYDPSLPPSEPAKSDGEGLVLAPLRALDLGLREGVFDLVFAPDLALLGDPESVLAQVRRLVGARGVALIGCRNEAGGSPWLPAPEANVPAPSYRAFYDLCALQFADVRMLGVVPFAAYAVAELGPDQEPAVAFDTSLTESPEAPEWFVAVVAQHGGASVLEAFDLVQFPRDELAKTGVDRSLVEQLEARLLVSDQKRSEAEARAGEAGLRAEREHAELASALDDVRRLRDKLSKLPREVEEERGAKRRLEAELAKVKPELAELRELRLTLEAELIEARTQLATPGVRGGVPLAEAQRMAEELAHALAEVSELRERFATQTRAESELRHRLDEKERELAASLTRAKGLEDRLENQLAEDSSRSNVDQETMTVLTQHARAAEALAERLQRELLHGQKTHEQEVQELEAALRARGAELRAARAENDRRERMLHELLAELETAQVSVEPVASALEASLENALVTARAERDQLARDAARREADLQSAFWRVAELERQIEADAQRVLGPEPARDLPNPPADKATELDALRQALQQEHERAAQLERRLAQGDDASLRAALAERDTLIAQLSAQLSAQRATSRGVS
ncbi:MAG: hypothetical protein JNL79_06225 [Myxococcales bacterium]|nr:hypothetical protein [Myxococcales bacterium]